MSSIVVAPREGSRTAWKTAQGPAKSINSVPSDTRKATRILPWVGGTSLVEGAVDGFVDCWAANPVPRWFRIGIKPAATTIAPALSFMKLLRATSVLTGDFLMRFMRLTPFLL